MVGPTGLDEVLGSLNQLAGVLRLPLNWGGGTAGPFGPQVRPRLYPIFRPTLFQRVVIEVLPSGSLVTRQQDKESLEKCLTTFVDRNTALS